MRKKSGRRASAVFKKRVEDIDAFLDQENRVFRESCG